jgi:hypothetical protein
MYEDSSSSKWSISYFTVNFLLRNNKYTCIHLSIRYITNHNCNPTVTASALQEARLSFPSGHSSYSTYAFVFLFVSLSILGVSGFPGSCVPRDGEPAWISRPRCSKARVPMNPEPTVEFASPGGFRGTGIQT